MSRFITAIIIFTLIISSSTASVIYISKSEKVLQSHLDSIVESATNGDMKQAEKFSEEFVEKWNSMEPLFIMLIRHHSVDEITKYSARLSTYCKYEKPSEAIAEARMIKTILKHMSDDEKPRMHNFF